MSCSQSFPQHDSVWWRLKHQQKGPHLKGRKGKLQAVVTKGQVTSRVSLLQEITTRWRKGEAMRTNKGRAPTTTSLIPTYRMAS